MADHLRLNAARVGTYVAMRDEISRYVDSRRAASEMRSNIAPKGRRQRLRPKGRRRVELERRPRRLLSLWGATIGNVARLVRNTNPSVQSSKHTVSLSLCSEYVACTNET